MGAEAGVVGKKAPRAGLGKLGLPPEGHRESWKSKQVSDRTGRALLRTRLL